MKVKKTFDGLTNSEIRRIERYANEITGYNDCCLVDYSSHQEIICGDPIVTVTCNFLRNYVGCVDKKIVFIVDVNDRRRSYIEKEKEDL